MKRTITIGTHEVEMVANAASPIFFKRAFKEDFNLIRQRLTDEKTRGDEAETAVGISELFKKMGYIMAKQAEANFPDVSEDDWIQWLMQFAPVDMDAASEDIILFYHESEKGSSIPKQ